MVRSKYIAVGLALIALIVAFSVPFRAQNGGAQEIHIYVLDFSFRPHDGNPGDPIRIEAGKPYLITFENEGGIDHEIRFGRNPTDNLDGYKENLFDGMLALHLRPGEFATLLIQVPAEKKGTWEIGCFLLGHYQAGQKEPFIIE
jgi:hypothetical protein